MPLLFSKLPPQPLDENLLVNGIDNEENDERNEAKNSFLQLDSEKALRVLEERRERQRKNPGGQQQDDQDREAPAPPILPFNSAEVRHQGAVRTFRVGDSSRGFFLAHRKSCLFFKIHAIGLPLTEIAVRRTDLGRLPSYPRWYFRLIATGSAHLHT